MINFRRPKPASWLDFHRKRVMTARTAHLVLAFFSGKTELCAAVRTFLVDMLAVGQLALAELKKLSKRRKKLTKRTVFRSAFGHIAREKTEHCIRKQGKISDGHE